MIKRENTFVEAMKFLKERNAQLALKEEQKINDRIKSHSEFLKEYYNIRQSRINNQIERNKIIEGARNAELATAIKAVYITALEAETLTDNGLLLAEELVDKYIVDEGGASKIMRECKDKTYILNRICDIVEEAALEDMRIIFEDEKEDDDDITKPEEEEEVDYDIKEDDKKEVIDDPETEEEVEVKDEDDDDKEADYDIEDSKDEADQIDDEDKEPEVKDEVEEELDDEDDDDDDFEDEDDDDIDDSDEDDDTDDDGEVDVEEEPEDYDNKVLEDLDKEEDVQKAVALIRQRVADAEETFIKNNAKDKEQINSLLGKISDNIKTVEDMSDKDKEKGKDAVAQENVRMSRRSIDHITNDRPLSIMEMFARNLNKDIIRDENLKEAYVEEDGSLDMDTIVESAKVLYGFLETLNTLQLKKVDAKYIESIFS
jgi:hypothetical protein